MKIAFRLIAATLVACAPATVADFSFGRAVPFFRSESDCERALLDLYKLRASAKVVSKRNAGTSADEEVTVDEILIERRALALTSCIQLPPFADSRFAGLWFQSEDDHERATIKEQCEKHVEYARVGGICWGYTTSKVEHSWDGKHCKEAKSTVVSREEAGPCTPEGVPL